MYKKYFFFLTAVFAFVLSLEAKVSDKKIDMIDIRGGKFIMGSEEDKSESPAREVVVSSFLIGKYEVTYSQWKYVYDWALTNGYEFDNEGQTGASYETIKNSAEYEDAYTGTGNIYHPALMINWYDVVKWCNAKSEMEELEPVYYTDSAKKNLYKKGNYDITPTMVNWRANGYRLPTEAEWEYAARGGIQGLYLWGNNEKDVGKYANILDESARDVVDVEIYIQTEDGFADTSIVGSLTPNKFGLYDMIGNAWEWVFDFYGNYANSFPIKDPKGPSRGSSRVIKGGGFYTNYPVRISVRYADAPYTADYSNGFRVVRNK